MAAIATASCGGSDSDSSASNAQTTTRSSSAEIGEPKGAEQEKLALIVENTYAYLAAGDAATVCERLTAAARKELGGTSCENAVGALIASAEDAGTLEDAGTMKVGEVTIDGEEGTAVMAFGEQTAQMEMRPGGDGWLLDSPPILPSN